MLYQSLAHPIFPSRLRSSRCTYRHRLEPFLDSRSDKAQWGYPQLPPRLCGKNHNLCLILRKKTLKIEPPWFWTQTLLSILFEVFRDTLERTMCMHNLGEIKKIHVHTVPIGPIGTGWTYRIIWLVKNCRHYLIICWLCCRPEARGKSHQVSNIFSHLDCLRSSRFCGGRRSKIRGRWWRIWG